MILTEILSASDLSLLIAIDIAIAASIRAARCPRCTGPLHAAHYQRKPRGMVEALDEAATLRLSLCCGWCRRRLTTPSVRFWGPLVYFGTIVTALIASPPRSAAERRMRTESGPSRQSVRRWRERYQRLWSLPIGRTIAGWIAPTWDRLRPQSVLSLWSGRWPFRAAMWQLLIHPLTGGRHWETVGATRGPLDAQTMDVETQLAALQDAARSP